MCINFYIINHFSPHFNIIYINYDKNNINNLRKKLAVSMKNNVERT